MDLLRLKRVWMRSTMTFKIGLVILSLHVVLAASGPFWAPHHYAEMGVGIPLSGMSAEHPLGVDQLGRDVLSRVVYGAHMVLLLSLCGTFVGLMVGAIAGLFSAYLGGWVDEVLQRFNEALISIPFLVLGLIAILAVGPRLSGEPWIIALVVALVYVPRIARIARSAALDVITRDYVTIARMRGESALSVVVRDVLPNTTGTLLVEFALRAGYAPVLIGSFGFLGFGLRPPFPEWGIMINENRDLIFLAPITVIGPGLALGSLVVGLNMFTEGFARLLGRTARLSAQ